MGTVKKDYWKEHSIRSSLEWDLDCRGQVCFLLCTSWLVGGPSLCSLTMGSAVPGADSFLLHISCPPSCCLWHLVHGVSLCLKSCANFLMLLRSDICSVGVWARLALLLPKEPCRHQLGSFSWHLPSALPGGEAGSDVAFSHSFELFIRPRGRPGGSDM